jgi:hypothetical protein
VKRAFLGRGSRGKAGFRIGVEFLAAMDNNYLLRVLTLAQNSTLELYSHLLHDVILKSFLVFISK